jgi:CDP-6-deoxy-D-xylo-4-hexulose-3-dehydrase
MTTIEGGMISTNNDELYELMKLKRSHGMARNLNPELFIKVSEQYPHIDPRFLFLTDGYNFRNTELGAVLGLCQLKKLDESIRIRKRNFSRFVSKLDPEKFYIPKCDTTGSSFCLPILCIHSGDAQKIKKLLEENSIETRPIVAGNLLLHPFLDKWKDAVQVPNAQTLNDNGVYVGNSQFVNDDMVDLLVTLLLDNV